MSFGFCYKYALKCHVEGFIYVLHKFHARKDLSVREGVLESSYCTVLISVEECYVSCIIIKAIYQPQADMRYDCRYQLPPHWLV